MKLKNKSNGILEHYMTRLYSTLNNKLTRKEVDKKIREILHEMYVDSKRKEVGTFKKITKEICSTIIGSLNYSRQKIENYDHSFNGRVSYDEARKTKAASLKPIEEALNAVRFIRDNLKNNRKERG